MSHKDRILRAAAVALLLYALVSLGREYRLLCRTEALAQELAETREELTRERDALEERLEEPLDEQELRRLAWERLGMVAPGERIYTFTTVDEDEGDREVAVWDWKLEALWKDG